MIVSEHVKIGIKAKNTSIIPHNNIIWTTHGYRLAIQRKTSYRLNKNQYRNRLRVSSLQSICSKNVVLSQRDLSALISRSFRTTLEERHAAFRTPLPPLREMPEIRETFGAIHVYGRANGPRILRTYYKQVPTHNIFKSASRDIEKWNLFKASALTGFFDLPFYFNNILRRYEWGWLLLLITNYCFEISVWLWFTLHEIRKKLNLTKCYKRSAYPKKSFIKKTTFLSYNSEMLIEFEVAKTSDVHADTVVISSAKGRDVAVLLYFTKCSLRKILWEPFWERARQRSLTFHLRVRTVMRRHSFAQTVDSNYSLNYSIRSYIF